MTVGAAYSATGAAWQHGPARVYERLAEVLVAAAPMSLAGRVVADVGAGAGAASRAIAAVGGRPIAFDLAPGMLRVDKANRPPAAVADGRALPVASRSLDAVVAAFTFNHLSDPHLALTEAARVLVPDGCLLASVYADDDGHPAKAAVDTAAAEAGWRPAAWVDDLRLTAMPLLATPKLAMAAAARSGFTASADVVAVPFPHLTPEDLVAWRLGMAPMAPFVASLPLARRRAIEARALDLLGAAEFLVRRVVVLVARHPG